MAMDNRKSLYPISLGRRSSAVFLGKPIVNNVFHAVRKLSCTKEQTDKKKFLPGVGSYSPNLNFLHQPGKKQRF
jgi:hypothetical protein